MNDAARATRQRLLGGASSLEQTDPELFAYFSNFAYDEVLADAEALAVDLDAHTRVLVQLASSVAAGSVGAFTLLARAALNVGVAPVALKETVYQSVAYVGMVRAIDFLHAANAVLTGRGIDLPLEGQSRSDARSRFEHGLAVQKQIVGDEAVDAMHANAPEDEKHFQRYLSANCFGDTVGRGGLDLRTRELVTFALLTALGGADGQLRGHVTGNLNVGNNRATMLAVLTVLVPYVGYPRTLNALAALDAVTGRD